MTDTTNYDKTIGILMVNTNFRRFVGDIGNAQTWSFPVRYKIVEEASPANVVDLADADLLEPFTRAADELIADGVSGITTTCGFLSYYQRELAEHCTVPVATSSLLQVPSIEQLLPSDKRVGVLTYNGSALTGWYLEAVGVAQDTPVQGMPPGSGFVRWIGQADDSVPYEQLEEESVHTATELLRRCPEVGAIVTECTNLAPFSRAIQDRLGVPVFDAVTMVKWFQSAVSQTPYPRPA